MMQFSEFERVMTVPRMGRYVRACNGDTDAAMDLYRLNLRLSQEMFMVIGCFEVALRNAIDSHCCSQLGPDWLKESIAPGGGFDRDSNCRNTVSAIRDGLHKLNRQYAHDKLVAELGFGFWRYQFAAHQYRATGRGLLRIFPGKPTSSAAVQYNATYVLNRLATINELRNRIAHHEPICFVRGTALKGSRNVREGYAAICELFTWMQIDGIRPFLGMEAVARLCDELDSQGLSAYFATESRFAP
jgi:hypothetical protein